MPGENLDCQLRWPGHPEMEVALGIRLCLRCQQEALETVVHMGRAAYCWPDVWRSEVGLRVETSAHRALPDWRVQSTCDPPESVPRFRLIGWASQERTKQVMMNLDGIDGLVELNRSLVYWCHGDYVPLGPSV